MTSFLEQLFAEGKIVFRSRPVRDRGAGEVLERTYALYSLEVAGPPVDFDARTALAAGELVAQACWFLLSHAEPEAELERCLVMPGPPRSAAQHLSADLVFRYLPHVHRRARAIAPDDLLPKRLADVLRQWPLSGVLSDVDDAPTTGLEFDGHPGLLLLYAERLARKEKAAWVPTKAGLEYVELVKSGRAS
jgi:hypothetical protein